MNTNLYSQLQEAKAEGHKKFAVLIDPDQMRLGKLDTVLQSLGNNHCFKVWVFLCTLLYYKLFQPELFTYFPTRPIYDLMRLYVHLAIVLVRQNAIFVHK